MLGRSFEDVLVQEQDGGEGLILRARRHVSVRGEIRKKFLYGIVPKLSGMRQLMKPDVPLDPPDIRFLRLQAIVPHPNFSPHLIDELHSCHRVLPRLHRVCTQRTTLYQ